MIGYQQIMGAWRQIQRAAEAIEVWVPGDADDMNEDDHEVAHWFYATAAANMGYNDREFMEWAIQYAQTNVRLLEENPEVAVAVMMQRSFAMGLMLGRTNPI